MSATAAKLTRHGSGVLPKGRNPLAHLLHALNQPLTGLQCSLELAASEMRSADQYIRTLREGLELTGRMRSLVEAIRELADTEPPDGEDPEPFRLDELLRDTVNDLLPVAQSIGIRISLVTSPLPVRAARHRLATLLFRLIDSGLSLAREQSDLQIVAASEPEHARLVVSWNQGPRPEHSPFSQPELGLLIAQAGWEQAGAEWSLTRAEMTQTCMLRLPLASPFTAR